jgi:hypothetical protein
MSEPAPSFTIYLDTNVISYLNANKVFNFLEVLIENGHKVVVSDTVLEELPDGNKTKILSEHEFLYLLSYEAVFIGEPTNFYRSVRPADTSTNVDAIEHFLRGILRSAAGSTSVGDLTSLLRDSLEAVADEIMKDLPDGTDQRTLDQLTMARIQFKRGLELLPPVRTPIVTKEEMEAYKMAPKHLNNVRPPNIVAKLVKLLPDSREWIEGLLVPFGEREDIKSRVQELCLALILVGFARDKGIGKDDSEKSDSGARSQFRDIGHICSAVACDLFVTSDKRCAKLAFAVFEALKLRTAVSCLIPGDSREVMLRVVGIDYWP